MLGTGSSIPNKVRNTSGMLLQIDEERSIILDCGEGTLGQLYRFFGEPEIYNVLKTIKVSKGANKIYKCTKHFLMIKKETFK